MAIFGKRVVDDGFPPSVPRIPEGVRVYAVGDIHGRADLLEGLLERIAAESAAPAGGLAPEVRLVALGDFIDRGAQSREVVERLAVADLPWRLDCLRGNHEAFALGCIDNVPGWDIWLPNGGIETLFSYGVDARSLLRAERLDLLRERFVEALPGEHLAFLRGLPTSLMIGDYFFCHAGVRPGVPLDRQTDRDLTWIREEFLSSPTWHGRRIVHGHTPVMEADVLPNRINVDTGAVLTNRLSCAVLEGETVRILST